MTIKVNEQVLRDAVEAIEFDLEHWNQAEFVGHREECGTTACLAGWIVAQTMGGDLNKLDHLSKLYRAPGSIPHAALDALEVQYHQRGTFYREVFLHVVSDNGDTLARTPAALKRFKERLTEVTGVEF